MFLKYNGQRRALQLVKKYIALSSELKKSNYKLKKTGCTKIIVIL